MHVIVVVSAAAGGAFFRRCFPLEELPAAWVLVAVAMCIMPVQANKCLKLICDSPPEPFLPSGPAWVLVAAVDDECGVEM